MHSPRHKSAYGWRAKLGLIVPPTNTVNEAEWARMMPAGVSFHTVRMPLHLDTVSAEGRRSLIASIVARVAELAQARVDVVAYACSAGSMINPLDALPREVEAATGTAFITTAASIVYALRHIGARRLSIATPYDQALNDHEVAFLADNGFETLSISGLGLGIDVPAKIPLIAETSLDAVAAHTRAAFAAGSDALLVTCTDFPTLPLLPALEHDLAVPVVTSNQATLWAALRRAGVADQLPNAGLLFRRQ